jgi:hypothetical protein
VTRDEPLHTGTTPAQITTLFAELPPVSMETLSGIWRAVAIPGVSPFYQVQIEKGWYGMRFTDPETVDSMLISTSDGADIFAADVLKIVAAAPGADTHLSQIRTQIETDQPMGRLRMISYRGAISAALIYDRQPVIDYFRTIDDTAVLCAAEARGISETGYCVLQRNS